MRVGVGVGVGIGIVRVGLGVVGGRRVGVGVELGWERVARLEVWWALLIGIGIGIAMKCRLRRRIRVRIRVRVRVRIWVVWIHEESRTNWGLAIAGVFPATWRGGWRERGRGEFFGG